MNLLENEDKSGLSRPLLSYNFSFFYYLELSIYKKSENGLLVSGEGKPLHCYTFDLTVAVLL